MARFVGASLFAVSLLLTALFTPDKLTQNLLGLVHGNETIPLDEPNDLSFLMLEEENALQSSDEHMVNSKIGLEDDSASKFENLEKDREEKETQLNLLLVQNQRLAQDNSKLRSLLSKNENSKSTQEKVVLSVPWATYLIRAISLAVMLGFFVLLLKKVLIKKMNAAIKFLTKPVSCVKMCETETEAEKAPEVEDISNDILVTSQIQTSVNAGTEEETLTTNQESIEEDTKEEVKEEEESAPAKSFIRLEDFTEGKRLDESFEEGFVKLKT